MAAAAARLPLCCSDRVDRSCAFSNQRRVLPSRSVALRHFNISRRIALKTRRLQCLCQVPSDDSSSIQLDLNLPRRRMIAEFTCNACNERTSRVINPHAYKRGTVFVQCGGCQVYHQLVDNLGLIVEYRFDKEDKEEEQDRTQNSEQDRTQNSEQDRTQNSDAA